MESATTAEPEKAAKVHRNTEPREYVVLRRDDGSMEDGREMWEVVWEGRVGGGANAAREEALAALDDDATASYDPSDLTMVCVAKRHWRPRSPKTRVVETTRWE